MGVDDDHRAFFRGIDALVNKIRAFSAEQIIQFIAFMNMRRVHLGKSFSLHILNRKRMLGYEIFRMEHVGHSSLKAFSYQAGGII